VSARSRFRTRTGAVLLAAAAPLACGPAADPARPPTGVLLVAIDGLRADHLSCAGYDRPTTPAIDALAADGVFFAQTFAASPLMIPSHASLVTGCDPNVARRFAAVDLEDLKERSWRVPDAAPHLAVEFLAAGYRTAAFVDDPLLDAAHGFGAGFQEYRLQEGFAPEGHTPLLIRRLHEWLRSVARDESWFVYLHLADLERSWSQPDRTWTGYFTARRELDEVPPPGNTDDVFFAIPHSRWRHGSRNMGQYEASYDGHLRRLDEELGKLVAGLRRAGRLDDTMIAVVGTHGIQFGEAGLYLRAGRYSMADLHVPWVLRPRSRPDAQRGRSIDALASLVDVAPTLLDLAGLARPESMQGVSQAGWVVGAPPAEPPRRYAFASCGIQTGSVVIGPRTCLESLGPETVVDEVLLRSWYGEWSREGGHGLRFYDRIATPFPPLDEAGVEPDDERIQELRRLRDEWLERVGLARDAMQHNALAVEEREGP